MQFFGIENIPSIVKASGTSLTLAITNNGQPTVIRVGGQTYTPASIITLNTGTIGFNGIDTGSLAANTLYYIYAVVSSNILGLVISTAGPSIGPTGFTSGFKFLGKLRTDFGSAAINTVAMDSSIKARSSDEEWQSFTPTGSWVTNTTYTGQWRRVLDVMEIRYKLTLGGLPTAANLSVNLPTGYTINNTSTNNTIANKTAGLVSIYDATGEIYQGRVGHLNSNLLGIYAENSSLTWGVIGNFVQQTQPITFALNDEIHIEAKVSIAEWKDLYT